MQAIAVTGGSSFVGRKLLKKFAEKKIKTRVLFRDLQYKDTFHEVIYGDVNSATARKKLFHNIDILINFIGRFHPPFSAQVDANVITLDTLCKSALENKVKKIIHISAAAAYGMLSGSTSFTEEDALNPDTEYGLSKKLGEEILYFYHKNYGIDYIIFRPTNIYGPDETHGVIFNFIKSIQKTGKITIYGNGKQRRDFLYIDDMVDAIIKSLSVNKSDIFNISYGETINLLELVRVFERTYNRKIPVVYKPAEPHVVETLTADKSKISRLLHWSPRITLEKGISLTIKDEKK